ncbi:MAG: glycosyltransferase family 39 protein, partial [Acidobacteriota bacterium]
MFGILRSFKAGSSPALEACVIGLLVLICLTSGIGLSPILNGDEARFAQASREMSLNRDWVVPTFGGQPRYDKPILIYWATAGSFRVFGVSPWAARLPSAIAAALCAALLAWSARRRWGPGAGLAAGLLLA